MSSHADTTFNRPDVDAPLIVWEYVFALERQLDNARAENQQLREALRAIIDVRFVVNRSPYAEAMDIAQAALAAVVEE